MSGDRGLARFSQDASRCAIRVYRKAGVNRNPGKEMTGQLRRRLIALAAVSLGAFAMVLLLNADGWRARILARLLRVNNWPWWSRRRRTFNRRFHLDSKCPFSPVDSTSPDGWQPPRTAMFLWPAPRLDK